jgi:hypothetical protein
MVAAMSAALRIITGASVRTIAGPSISMTTRLPVGVPADSAVTPKEILGSSGLNH